MARTVPDTVTVKITETEDVVRTIAQAIHDEFLPGTDGHDTCSDAGGARAAIRLWAERRGIALEDTMPEERDPDTLDESLLVYTKRPW